MGQKRSILNLGFSTAIAFALFVFLLLIFPLRNSVNASESLYFIHSDHLGSSSIISDINGDSISKQAYYPYGDVKEREGDLETEREYTGQISDREETGLYYYNARYYNSKIGIFTQADTVGTGYGYVNGNPINRIDPTGHQGICIGKVCYDPETGLTVPIKGGPTVVVPPDVIDAGIEKGGEIVQSLVGGGGGGAVSVETETYTFGGGGFSFPKQFSYNSSNYLPLTMRTSSETSITLKFVMLAGILPGSILEFTNETVPAPYPGKFWGCEKPGELNMSYTEPGNDPIGSLTLVWTEKFNANGFTVWFPGYDMLVGDERAMSFTGPIDGTVYIPNKNYELSRFFYKNMLVYHELLGTKTVPEAARLFLTTPVLSGIVRDLAESYGVEIPPNCTSEACLVNFIEETLAENGVEGWRFRPQ